jgi:hypothetical protein
MKVTLLLRGTRRMNRKLTFFLNNRIATQTKNKSFLLNIVKMAYFFQVFTERIKIDKTSFLLITLFTKTNSIVKLTTNIL